MRPAEVLVEFFCKITRKILKLIYDKIYKKYGDIPYFRIYLADKALKIVKINAKEIIQNRSLITFTCESEVCCFRKTTFLVQQSKESNWFL